MYHVLWSKEPSQDTEDPLVPAVSAGNRLCFFYSANRLSFGVGLKAVAASLSLTAVQLGTIGTIFTLGQALIDIPAGYLADRFGRKRIFNLRHGRPWLYLACVTTSASFVGAAFWRVCFGIFERMLEHRHASVAGSIFPAAPSPTDS